VNRTWMHCATGFVTVFFDGMLDRVPPIPCFKIPRGVAPLSPRNGRSVFGPPLAERPTLSERM
jgi:hypothetical protein